MAEKKVFVISDLHLEFQLDGGMSLVTRLPEADVAIVAGDLTNARSLPGALKMLSRKYADVIFVPGNHEYYGGSREMVLAAKETRPDNVHWLDRDTVELHGQRFVGCTLWFPDTAAARLNTKFMGDFHHIKDHSWLWDEFRLCQGFLDQTVLPSDIVVTHHLPTPKSVAPRFDGNLLNCYFLADASNLVRSKWWVHGHTHDACDYMHGQTRVICNPVGYPGERQWAPVWIGGIGG